VSIGPGAAGEGHGEEEVASGEEGLVNNINCEGNTGDVNVTSGGGHSDSLLAVAREPSEEALGNLAEGIGAHPLAGGDNGTHGEESVRVNRGGSSFSGEVKRGGNEGSGGTHVKGEVSGNEDTSEVANEIIASIVLEAELVLSAHAVLDSLRGDVESGGGANSDGHDDGETSVKIVRTTEGAATDTHEGSEEGEEEDHGGGEVAIIVDTVDVFNVANELFPGPAATHDALLGELNSILDGAAAAIDSVVEVKVLELVDEGNDVGERSGTHL